VRAAHPTAQPHPGPPELGAPPPPPPRLITGWARAPAGTDGGMTLLGTTGGALGAGFIAALSYVLGYGGTLALAAAGVTGMLVDSLLGATVQGKVRWMDNDAVNLAATLTGAVCARLFT